MPLSKKREVKKGNRKGKPVGRGEDRLSGLTLQDLINVVAYQEAHPEEAQGTVKVKDLIEDEHTVLADDAKIHIPVDLPVTVENKDGTKRRVGTATAIPGDPEHVSIQIDDPDFIPTFHDNVPNFSIDKVEDQV